jgi:hypothetical protein
LRAILKVQGVASQKNWLVVLTAAPAGSVLTVQVSLAPRVTVAQPPTARQSPANIKIRMN